MKRNPLVCHITIGHSPTDDRIFYKEVSTLANEGYRVALVAPAVSTELPSVTNVSFHLFPPGKYWQNLWRAYRMAKTLKADLYHLHEFELLPFGIWLKYKYQRKVIYDAHESVFWFFLDFSRRNILIRFFAGLLAQSLEYGCLRLVDYVITVTPWVEAHLRPFHPRRAIVYNFPLISLFEPQPQEQHQPVILYHGQLVPGRNIELMVEAMAIVRQALPEANLWLVGKASSQYLAHLHQKIDRLGVSQNVTIQPAIPYHQVPALIARATLGLAALQLNESYRRSIQVKPFEFMAMGVPVLGTKVPSISKFVVASGAGLVVDPLTPAQLASQIIELLQNPAIRVKMGLSGRQAVLQKYNWEQTKTTLLKVYQSLLPC